MTFYWYDYETFGVDPQRDRPAQFAGVRTDENFTVVGEPLNIFCCLPLDYLPQPESCLITGITPQHANQEGVAEAKFIGLIHEQLARPNTCGIGYNNIRFDDEVTRNCLYRNFFDPYAREWQNGNSRWDLLDVIRAARALRPDGIIWPQDSDGLLTVKLDQLTIANNIAHDAAHDALSDVFATIALAKLLKQSQPKLYQFLFDHRGKQAAIRLLQLGAYQPVIHVSGRYPTAKYNLAIVVAICKHPINNNGYIVYDLSIDPEPMLAMGVEEIRERVFTARQDMPDDMERIPLKTVHVNKCPVLAPLTVMRPQDAERLGIDLSVCQTNLHKIRRADALQKKIAEVHIRPYQDEAKLSDPDLAIYSGGFFSDNDKRAMIKIRSAAEERLSRLSLNFNDGRLQEMFFRYKARNFPESLSTDERAKWISHCFDLLSAKDSVAATPFDRYFTILEELERKGEKREIVVALREFGLEKLQHLRG